MTTNTPAPKFDLDEWALEQHPDYPVHTFEDAKVQRHRELMRSQLIAGYLKAQEQLAQRWISLKERHPACLNRAFVGTDDLHRAKSDKVAVINQKTGHSVVAVLVKQMSKDSPMDESKNLIFWEIEWDIFDLKDFTHYCELPKPPLDAAQKEGGEDESQ
jgi:hypothetical protein